jgi:hypothetical protein
MNLPPSDCVVEWHGGGLEAKVHEHQKLMTELVASAGAPVTAPDAPPVVPAPNTPVTTPDAAPPAPAAAEPAKTRAAELLGDEELVEALK